MKRLISLSMAAALFASGPHESIAAQNPAFARQGRALLVQVRGDALRRMIRGSVIERGDRKTSLWQRRTFHWNGRYTEERTGDFAHFVPNTQGTYRVSIDRYCVRTKAEMCFAVFRNKSGRYFERDVAVGSTQYMEFPIRRLVIQ